MDELGSSHWRLPGFLAVGLACCCLAVLVMTGQPAGALTGDLACSGDAVVVFAPALNGARTTASVSAGRLFNCGSPNGSHPSLKSATLRASGLTANGCFPLFDIRGYATFGWNDGKTSTAIVSFSTDPQYGIRVNIRITAGPMAGDTVTPVPVFIPSGLCGLGGTSSLAADLPTVLFTH